jgi:predicted transcriptional regulator of viral defense system
MLTECGNISSRMIKGKEKLLEFAEERKIFRARDVEEVLGISRTYIQRLVDEGKLIKVSRGIYSLATHSFSESQSLIEVAVKAPNAVVCLLSALQFHELTTQNPFEVWIAVERETRIPKIDSVMTRIFRFSPKIYQAGIETHLIDGVELKVYSAAKTVADCFWYEKTIGLDVAIEALRDTWRKRKATMDELYHFAEIRRVKNKMIPYLNSLTM